VKQTDLQRRSSVLERVFGSNFTILRYYSGLHVARASTLKKPAKNFCNKDKQLKKSDWEKTEDGEGNNQKAGKFS
jgi:hypothetical protein